MVPGGDASSEMPEQRVLVARVVPGLSPRTPERLGKWAGPRQPGKFWLSRGLGATGGPACRWAAQPPTHDLGE